MERAMVSDILLQIGIILTTLFMFLAMLNIPQKLFSKLRFRNRSRLQSKNHFVRGAQLLSQARSAPSRSAAASIAASAVAEADASISLDPTDAAAHILKALALDFQGFKTSALDAIDAALSPLASKSLEGKEMGDALFKRAELKMGLSRRGRVDSALDDLTRAVALSGDNAKAYSLLGECYEVKKMREEAKRAYEEALKLQPNFAEVRAALDKLAST